MSPAPIESSLPESATGASPSSHSVSANHKAENRRFFHLRGVQWRIDLGILPSSSQASVDDLRRVTADCRRRYAGLRRHLLVDPHNPKDGSNSPDMVMDNPLSQNPDSTWGRFFRNAELEKMVDQDLSRLYPERGSYFQTPGCQGMLRRILLLWCLRHPEYGYQQGMHELLAPLLYVLNIDLEHLSQVRKLYEDHFTDKFDGLSFNDSDLLYNFNLKKPPDSTEDEFGSHGNAAKIRSIDELDPQVQTIVLLSDAYGAEGELGIVLSEKFTEHDAYCMFDALMSGAHSAFAMADFFSPFPAGGSHAGLPPVIEASTALYHLLSLVDSSLHTHLVELGVEPQYFSLRWLRVLFGREFSLEDLLVIWDEIFASENKKSDTCDVDDESSALWFLSTSRGAFISAIAVSMLLYLRSSLLATENATSCLQRLLNFPENVDLQKLIEKAKSLQTLALNAKFSSLPPSYGRVSNYSKSKVVRGHSNSFDAIMPNSPLNLVPESYWEEKWRVLHMEEQNKGGSRQQIAAPKRRWSDKVRFLSRTESDPFQVKPESDKKGTKSSVRRRLLQDLSHALGSEEDIDERRSNEVLDNNDNPSVEGDVDNRQDGSNKDSQYSTEKRDLNVNGGSEENSSLFSEPTSPLSGANDHENDSGSSSVASNLSLDQNDDPSRTVLNDSPLQASDQLENGMEKSGTNNDHENDSVRSSVASNLSLHQNDDPLRTIMDDSPLKASDQLENGMEKSGTNKDSVGISVIGTKDRKGKFQWFWKFGKNSAGEGTSDQGGAAWEAPISPVSKSNQGKNIVGSSTVDQSSRSYVSSKGDNVDQNVMVTLKNLGQSMLEHIQVIESAFQQERGQVASLENFSKNGLVGKGQVTATAALTELRKISNLLSEM